MKRDPGNMSFNALIVIITFMMLMSISWEYVRIFSVLNDLDNSVVSSVEGVAQENWDEIYQGVREGYAGAYTKDELTDDWEEIINRKQIIEQMKEMYDFEEDGLLLTKVGSDGKTIFSIEPDEMEITVINTSFDDDEGAALVVEATNTVVLPFMFLAGMFDEVPAIEFERTTKVRYVPKF